MKASVKVREIIRRCVLVSLTLCLIFTALAFVRFVVVLKKEIELDQELCELEKLVGTVPDRGRFGEAFEKSIMFGMPSESCGVEHVKFTTLYRAGEVYSDQDGKIVAVSRPDRAKTCLPANLILLGKVVYQEYPKYAESPFMELADKCRPVFYGLAGAILLSLLGLITRRRGDCS